MAIYKVENFINDFANESVNPNEENQLIKEILCKFRYFRIIKILKEKDSFGEIAIRINTPRTASIVCREDCQFAVLKINSFDKIKEIYKEKYFQNNLKFLKKVKIFKDWPVSKLTVLLAQVKMETFLRNKVKINLLLFFIILKKKIYFYKLNINFSFFFKKK